MVPCPNINISTKELTENHHWTTGAKATIIAYAKLIYFLSFVKILLNSKDIKNKNIQRPIQKKR